MEDKGLIKCADPKMHDEMMNVMREFFDDEKPQVGIFWYDYRKNSLFGVMKDDADKYIREDQVGTYPKLHQTYWKKQHSRAVALGDTKSVFYGESNYTMIPRGRVFVRPDGTLYVTIGEWIKDKNIVDETRFRYLLVDEFNLPEDFEFVQDEHWNIGQGWGE